MYEENNQHPSALILVGQGLSEIGETLKHYRGKHASPRVRRAGAGFVFGILGSLAAIVLLMSWNDASVSALAGNTLVMLVAVASCVTTLVGFLSTPHASWNEQLVEQLANYMPLDVAAYNALQMNLTSGIHDCLEESERWYVRERNAIDTAFAVTGVNDWARP